MNCLIPPAELPAEVLAYLYPGEAPPLRCLDWLELLTQAEAAMFGTLTQEELREARRRKVFSSNPADLPAEVRARMREGRIRP